MLLYIFCLCMCMFVFEGGWGEGIIQCTDTDMPKVKMFQLADSGG